MKSYWMVLVCLVLFGAPLFSQTGKPQPKPQVVIQKFVPEPAPDGKAVVYLFRSEELDGGATPLVFTKDGPLGVLPSHSFYRIVANPGPLALWISFLASSQFALNLEAGVTYYLQAKLHVQYAQAAVFDFILPKETDLLPPKELDGSRPLQRLGE